MSLKWLLKLLSCDEDEKREWRRNYISELPLYEYVNFQRGGKLIDVFNKKNTLERRTEALNKIIRTEIVRFLYDGGKGKVVRSKRSSFAPPTSVSIEDFNKSGSTFNCLETYIFSGSFT